VPQGCERAAKFARIEGTVRFAMLLRELGCSVRREVRSANLLRKDEQQGQQQMQMPTAHEARIR
jgi:hypothetical protein